MKNNTKTTLRMLSVVLVLALVLMELNVLPNVLNYRFWFMVLAYGLALITFKA